MWHLTTHVGGTLFSNIHVNQVQHCDPARSGTSVSYHVTNFYYMQLTNQRFFGIAPVYYFWTIVLFPMFKASNESKTEGNKNVQSGKVKAHNEEFRVAAEQENYKWDYWVT